MFARSSQSESASASDSPPIFPRRHLCGLDVLAVDGALDAAVCCALAGHLGMAAGATAARESLGAGAGENISAPSA